MSDRAGHAVARQTGLQQLHADAGQVRGIGPDDSSSVEEADVPDRTLADATAGVDEQRVVEAGLLGQAPIVEKWKCADMLRASALRTLSKGI